VRTLFSPGPFSGALPLHPAGCLETAGKELGAVRQSLLLPEAAAFAGDFEQADTSWQRAVSALSLKDTVHAYPKPISCPSGAPLQARSLWIGKPDAYRVLVVLSGVHGIEGAVGSAVQLDLLQAFDAQRWELPSNWAILLVHALNPWGYAWNRRCDEHGVDLNRNGINFIQPPPANPHYAELVPSLRLRHRDERQAALAAARQTLGDQAYEIGISGGQYTDPNGPFFGGHEPAFGRLLSEELIAHYALAKRHVVCLDVHSGLGPYAYAELICDHPSGSEGLATAAQLFGDALAHPASGTSSSVPKWGLLDDVWHAALGRASCYVTLEFGTLGTESLFAVLLDDAAIWAAGCPDKATRTVQAQAMRAHFVPADPYWQARVLWQSRLVIHQVIGDTPWG
jgi:hypothetical protein